MAFRAHTGIYLPGLVSKSKWLYLGVRGSGGNADRLIGADKLEASPTQDELDTSGGGKAVTGPHAWRRQVADYAF